MKTTAETPSVHAISRVDHLTHIRSMVGECIRETESRLGVVEGFPVTIEFARVYDEIDRMIQRKPGASVPFNLPDSDLREEAPDA
jgi:hypothetical protein